MMLARKLTRRNNMVSSHAWNLVIQPGISSTEEFHIHYNQNKQKQKAKSSISPREGCIYKTKKSIVGYFLFPLSLYASTSFPYFVCSQQDIRISIRCSCPLVYFCRCGYLNSHLSHYPRSLWCCHAMLSSIMELSVPKMVLPVSK
jgi:hypothetical protein